jgi:hypothetical protein
MDIKSSVTSSIARSTSLANFIDVKKKYNVIYFPTVGYFRKIKSLLFILFSSVFCQTLSK